MLPREVGLKTKPPLMLRISTLRWSWEKGEALAHVQTHKEPVYGLCALPASGGASAAFCVVGKGYGRVFRASDGEEGGTQLGSPRRAESSTPLKLAGRERANAQLAAIGDAKLLTLGSDKGTLHRYTHADGKAAGKVVKDAHAGPVNALAVGPAVQGKPTLLSCGKDGQARRP